MEKSMRVRVIALTVGAVAPLFLASFEAQACGESLFRVGRGAAYRAQTAPLPGNVLLVAPSADAKALADRLAAAGHHVRVVETADLIAAELDKGQYDVVLASFNDREIVAAQTAGATGLATFPSRPKTGRKSSSRSVQAASVGRRRLHAVPARHPSHAESVAGLASKQHPVRRFGAIAERSVSSGRRRDRECAFGTARAQDEPLVPERTGAACVRRAGVAEPRGQWSFTYQNQKTQDLASRMARSRAAAVHTHLSTCGQLSH